VEGEEGKAKVIDSDCALWFGLWGYTDSHTLHGPRYGLRIQIKAFDVRS
jgi:hypothetical protein